MAKGGGGSGGGKGGGGGGKGEAVAPGKVEVAPLAVEARVVAVAKATVRRVVGQAQLAIFLAVAEAMRLRPKRSFV